MTGAATATEEAAGDLLAGGILSTFTGFIEELRAAGVPVSTTEVLDATEAVRHLPLEDRQAWKLGLAATLVKQEGHWHAFETLFDLYFSLRLWGDGDAPADFGPDGQALAGDGQELTASQLAELAYRALMEGDRELIVALAPAAVSRFAGMEPGRPVGGSYYVFKTLRQLGTDGLLARMLASAEQQGGLEGVLLADDYRRRLEQLRSEVETEVQRRLIADRGADAVARTLRRPLPEDVDFMHLGKDELVALQRSVQPLARKLAVHLARKRRRRQGGRLDFRATMRRSLSTGGVPVEPRFKAHHPAKPELWALADVSGSVAAFARFTLQLVYALSSQFSRTRVLGSSSTASTRSPISSRVLTTSQKPSITSTPRPTSSGQRAILIMGTPWPISWNAGGRSSARARPSLYWATPATTTTRSSRGPGGTCPASSSRVVAEP